MEAAEGYELDKQYKTVYVKPGKTVEIEWTNTPITGQIQVYKYAAEANPVTGDPAGKPLQGAVYEISQARSGKVVDYITTDARGVAASKPLPLGRYKVVEVTAPAYYQLSGKTFDETLEYSGQIIKVSDYDKPANLKVTITKTGNKQLSAGDSMRYDLTVSNTSNVALDNFFWHLGGRSRQREAKQSGVGLGHYHQRSQPKGRLRRSLLGLFHLGGRYAERCFLPGETAAPAVQDTALRAGEGGGRLHPAH